MWKIMGKSLFKNRILKIFALLMVVFCQTVYSAFSEEFFWDNPKSFAGTGDYRFPRVVKNGNESVIFWQEVDSSKNEISLSCSYQNENRDWIINKKFAGPFKYSGEVPDIYYACQNNKKILVSVNASSNEVQIFSSTDGGRTFLSPVKIKTEKPIVSPRIFASGTKGFVLFTSMADDVSSMQSELEENGYFQSRKYFMYSAESEDGENWSSFRKFLSSENLVNPFVPVLAKTDSFEFLAFRASRESPPSYKIFGCYRDLNGGSWSNPILLSDKDTSELQDQTPDLYAYKNEIYLAWERTERSGRTGWKKSVMSGKISKNGLVPESIKKIYAKGNPMNPVLFDYDGLLSVCFFDKSSDTESTVYTSSFVDDQWERAKKLSSGSSLDIFPRPVVSKTRYKVIDPVTFEKKSNDSSSLSFVWQRNSGSQNDFAKPYLLLKERDVYVAQSRIDFKSGQNIKKNRHNNISSPGISIVLPDDVSKSDGFTWSWSQDENVEPSVNESDITDKISQYPHADSEGTWYFKVRVHDKAGNWSDPSVLKYYYDITPPSEVVFNEPAIDSLGFVKSNSTGISWKPSEEDDDTVYYSYRYKIRKLTDIPKNMTERKKHKIAVSAEKVRTFVENLFTQYGETENQEQRFSSSIKFQMSTKSFWNNIENGLYLVTVYAVDSVGNAGPQKSILLALNKYQPWTWIKSIATTELPSGDISMNLWGHDFLYDGTVTSVFLDKDGKAPYDMEIKASASNFKVYSDRIEDINLGNQLDEGTYFVGVLHSDRGITWTSKAPLKIQTNGTVKIDNEFEYVPEIDVTSKSFEKHINIGLLVLFITVFAALIFAVYFLFGIINNIRETADIRNIVLEISMGDSMKSSELLKNGKPGKIRKGSLKFQLIGFTVSLVILIVVPIAARLGSTMIENQKLTLSQGLQDRIDFLLSSFYTGSTTYMPEKNGEYRLSSLRDQVNTVEGAKSVTITGFSKNEGKTDSLLYLWTTNDPSEQYQSSKNLIASSPKWKNGFETVNEEYQELSQQTGNSKLIKDLSSEIDRIGNLYGTPGVDDDENGKKEQEARINMENALLEIAKERSGFIPSASLKEGDDYGQNISEYNFSDFAVQVSDSIDTWKLLSGSSFNGMDTSYLCYRPVLYRAGSSPEYVRGIVFIQADTLSLIEEMKVVTREIIINVVVISIIAIVLGVVGAIFLARLIVGPIKKVMLRARAISDSLREKGKENDVRKFEGQNLEIKRRDEIGELILSINSMTKNLVRAKYDEEEALQNAKMDQDAAVVQGSLLPKERSFSNSKFEFFSYYLGADRVSGDYFDYKVLDDRWYVVIKSDASGHGTPAGLITAIVATLFRKYFEKWTYKANGIRINELVAQINDFLNNLGLKGKFATIMLGLYDNKTGDIYLCNAGDNLIHLFRTATGKVETVTLSNSPAAGQIDQFMIDMKGGYKIDKLNLSKGDVIFFYTDGVEENNRKLRKVDFSEYTTDEIKDMKNFPEEVNIENVTEEMGPSRVLSVLEAALDKRQYELTKVMNPVTGEKLMFDFTKGQGSSRDAILGLASVEKVFRLYKPLGLSKENQVDVDKSIDEYLQTVFNQYGYYAEKSETTTTQGATTLVQYTGVRQEVQADDLTLIAFRRLE